MKIKINYDLIEKINQSSNGLKLQKVLMFVNLFNLPSNAISLVNIIKLFKPETMTSALEGALVFTAMEIIFTINAKIIQLLLKEIIQLKATKDLEILITQLLSLDVKTTTDLLKQYKVIGKNYEINYEDNKMPVLKQKKYINVPLINGYEETLCQEHSVGSRKYVLSVQEPTKKLKFKTVKTTG